MKRHVVWMCVCGAVALAASLPAPIAVAPLGGGTGAFVDPVAAAAAAAVLAGAEATSSASDASTDARAKRSHGLLSLVASKVTGKIGSLSAASSGHGGDTEYHVEYPPSFGHKSFDLWGFKKALLSTLLQAVKAIKGGLIALKGQLIKAKGHILTTKGNLIKAKGEAITDFGRHIATKALWPTPTAHTAPSSHTYSAPGEHSFKGYKVGDMFSGWDNLWADDETAPSGGMGYDEHGPPDTGHGYGQEYDHHDDSNYQHQPEQQHHPTNYNHAPEQHSGYDNPHSSTGDGHNQGSYDEDTSHHQYQDSGGGGGGYDYQPNMGHTSGHEGDHVVNYASDHQTHPYSHSEHRDSTPQYTHNSNQDSDHVAHDVHDTSSYKKGHHHQIDHPADLNHLLNNLINDAESHISTDPSPHSTTNAESDYFPNSILAHTSTHNIKPTSDHNIDNSGDITLPVALPPLKHSSDFSIQPSIELKLRKRLDRVFPMKHGFLPGLGLKKPLSLGLRLPDFPLFSSSETKEEPTGPQSYLMGETSTSPPQEQISGPDVASEEAYVSLEEKGSINTTNTPDASSSLVSNHEFSRVTKTNQEQGEVQESDSSSLMHRVAKRESEQHGHVRKGKGRKGPCEMHVKRDEEDKAASALQMAAALLPVAAGYLPPHSYYGPPPSAPSVQYGVPWSAPYARSAPSASGKGEATGEIKLPDGVQAGLLILKPLKGGVPAAAGFFQQASDPIPAIAPDPQGRSPASATDIGDFFSIQRSLDLDSPTDFGTYFHRL